MSRSPPPLASNEPDRRLPSDPFAQPDWDGGPDGCSGDGFFSAKRSNFLDTARLSRTDREILGSGAYGFVCRGLLKALPGYDEESDLPVALKFFSAGARVRSGKREFVFMNELNASDARSAVSVRSNPLCHGWSTLPHPLSPDLGLCFVLVMDLYDCDLKQWLEGENRNSHDQFVVLRQCTQSLQALHRNNIIHADVKLENFLVRRRENRWEAVVADCGESKHSLSLVPPGQRALPSTENHPDAAVARHVSMDVERLFGFFSHFDSIDSAFDVLLKLPADSDRLAQLQEMIEHRLEMDPMKDDHPITEILMPASYGSNPPPESLSDQQIVAGFTKIREIRKGLFLGTLRNVEKGINEEAVLCEKKPTDAERAKLRTAVYRATTLRHLPRIVRHFGIVERTNTYDFASSVTTFVCMEHCNGSDCESWIKKRVRDLNWTDPHLKLKLLFHAAQGLRSLHGLGMPIIHRDIKPANFLISEGNDPGGNMDVSLKIGDLDSMRYCCTMRETPYVFTPGYHLGHGDSDLRKIDIFSFAISCWEIWVGRRAITAEKIWELKGRDPDEFSSEKVSCIPSPLDSPQMFLGGFRPPLEDCVGMPDELKALINRGWSLDAVYRPWMSEWELVLGDLVEKSKSDEEEEEEEGENLEAE